MDTRESPRLPANSSPLRLTVMRTVAVMILAAVIAAVLHVQIGQYHNTLWYDVAVALGAAAIIAPIFLYPTYMTAHRLRQANATILRQARRDNLTGLPNYFALSQEIRDRLASDRSEHGLAVHFLDLDHFKHVNDSLGHDFGNDLLVNVAQCLNAALSGRAFVARFAGDEFVVVQPVAGSVAEAKDLVAVIRQAAARDYHLHGRQVHVDLTIGTAIAPFHAGTPDGLLKAAELALYHAKKCGLTAAVYTPELSRDVERMRELEAALPAALDLAQFFVLYQPIVDARQTARITSVEALLRWRMPDGTLISPAEFVPAAERTGTIIAIGEWVLAEACRQCAGWPRGITVSVNVSPVQFFRSDIVATVRRVLGETGLPARRLTLEITETALISDTRLLEPILGDLRAMGVRLALDDFGAGFCGLNYLRLVDIDKLKVDKTIVDQAFYDRKSFSVLKGVAEIARGNHICIVTEGIDDPRKEQLVCENRIADELQGYLYHHPMHAEDLPRVLNPLQAADERRRRRAAAAPGLALH